MAVGPNPESDMKRILGAALAAVFVATAAFSQGQNCAPLDMMLEGFAEKYGERVVMVLKARENDFFVLVNDQSQSWTVLAVLPGGMACVVSVGEGVPTMLPIGLAL